MNKRIQDGFTLIELVVVVTILGILAAFAVPRFASLEGQARLASTQALAGSVRRTEAPTGQPKWTDHAGAGGDQGTARAGRRVESGAEEKVAQ